MQLTKWTDYSLRVLMYCAQHYDREEPITIDEILEFHQLSKSHITKIVSQLANSGLLITTRGRLGGISLAKPAHKIYIGEVVRLTETDFNMVECFNKKNNNCKITNRCKLKHHLFKATDDFLKTLDGVSLSQVIN